MVADGRMVFKDTTAFRLTMEHLQGLSLEEVGEWDGKNGIASLLEKYEQVEADSTKETLGLDSLFTTGQLLCIPDSRLAAVLNQEGVLQIGEVIFKTKQREVFAIPATRTDLLQKADWANPAVTRYEVKFDFWNKKTDPRPIITVTDPNTSQPVAARYGNFFGWSERDQPSDQHGNLMPTTWNNRPTRMKCIQWNVSWPYYSSVGVRTKYQFKSRVGGWKKTDASHLWASGQFDYRIVGVGPITYAGGGNQAWGTEAVEHTIASTSVPGAFYFLEQSWSTHSATYRNATAFLLF